MSRVPWGYRPAGVLRSQQRLGRFTWPLVYAVVGYLVLCRPARPLIGLPVYVVASVAILVATLAVGYDKWPDNDAGLLVFAATFGLLWVVTAVPIKNRFQPAILSLSQLTFGVYLVHPLVQDYVLIAFKLTSVRALVVAFPLTLGGAVLLAALWHRSRTLAAVLG